MQCVQDSSDIVEDITTFREEFSTLLSNMKTMKHSCYVCGGDYNIDLLKVKTNKHYCEYFDEVHITRLYFKNNLTYPNI